MENQHFKKTRWKKIILIFFGVIVLFIAIIIVLPGFLNLFAKDIPPINDSDILLSKVSVPDDQNAYFDLIKLDKLIYEPEEKAELVTDMASGTAWDEALAAEIVERNTEAFAVLAEAARKQKFQDPTTADPVGISPTTVSPSKIPWFRVAHLSAVRIRYLAQQGKDKAAMEEALNLVKIGQKIQESQAQFIEYVVAMAMKEIGLAAIQNMMSSSKLNSSELSEYAKALDAFYKNEDGLINVFKAGYHIQAWTVDALAGRDKKALAQLAQIVGEKDVETLELAKKVKNNYYFQPNKTKLMFAEDARASIENVSQLCGEMKTNEVSRLVPENRVKLYTEENAIGKILHDAGAASLTAITIKKCEEDVLVAATQAMLAIKAYKDDIGHYPNSLNDLVPRYLASIPMDPFDGKPLKYSAAKKFVYSVGQDLQDVGGSTGEDWRKMPDPTFKFVF